MTGSEKLCFNSNFFQVLLITSSAHPDRWIVPGGKMQLNESPEFSAMREAIEEGGAIGLLGRSLGTYDNTDRRHRTKVFVLYVNQLAEDYDDKDLRRRKWFSVDEAQKLLVAFKPLQAKYVAALIQTFQDTHLSGATSSSRSSASAATTTTTTTSSSSEAASLSSSSASSAATDSNSLTT
jgi:diphosphoinositol-polyphosphate diphosphatase